MDFIYNGQARGSVASVLLQNNFDTNALRPYIGDDGRSYITVNSGRYNAQGQPIYMPMVTNAPATLRIRDWIMLDQAVIAAAQKRLAAVADLRGQNLQLVIPNGMGKTVLQSQMMSDTTPATISMDGLRKSENDRPTFDSVNLPLPIIHKDFSFTARDIQVSRSGGSPLDTSMAELAARQVAESAEQLVTGTAASYSYGGGAVYGMTTFPSRNTKTMTSPLAGGWTGATLIAEILAMKQQSIDDKYYGPWMLYVSNTWDQYLDTDYVPTGGVTTSMMLRERIAKIDKIQGVKTLDFLPAKTMVLVEMNTNVVRIVVGMEVVTLQWEEQGGMLVNFKVMTILVPQFRADINGNTGVVHGTHA